MGHVWLAGWGQLAGRRVPAAELAAISPASRQPSPAAAHVVPSPANGPRPKLRNSTPPSAHPLSSRMSSPLSRLLSSSGTDAGACSTKLCSAAGGRPRRRMRSSRTGCKVRGWVGWVGGREHRYDAAGWEESTGMMEVGGREHRHGTGSEHRCAQQGSAGPLQSAHCLLEKKAAGPWHAAHRSHNRRQGQQVGRRLHQARHLCVLEAQRPQPAHAVLQRWAAGCVAGSGAGVNACQQLLGSARTKKISRWLAGFPWHPCLAAVQNAACTLCSSPSGAPTWTKWGARSTAGNRRSMSSRGRRSSVCSRCAARRTRAAWSGVKFMFCNVGGKQGRQHGRAAQMLCTAKHVDSLQGRTQQVQRLETWQACLTCTPLKGSATAGARATCTKREGPGAKVSSRKAAGGCGSSGGRLPPGNGCLAALGSSACPLLRHYQQLPRPAGAAERKSAGLGKSVDTRELPPEPQCDSARVPGSAARRPDAPTPTARRGSGRASRWLLCASRAVETISGRCRRLRGGASKCAVSSAGTCFGERRLRDVAVPRCCA